MNSPWHGAEMYAEIILPCAYQEIVFAIPATAAGFPNAPCPNVPFAGQFINPCLSAEGMILFLIASVFYVPVITSIYPLRHILFTPFLFFHSFLYL